MHYKCKVKLIVGHFYKDAKGSIFRVQACTNIKMHCRSDSCKNKCLDLAFHSDGKKASMGYALCADSYKVSTLIAELTPEEQAFYAL
jgi:hypothetical protein